ncbi:MAG: UbiA family prenyltransferase [Magnetococcales bacterium]|nr:UbiA family prenyltransferase [Magnetococcales bacterium]
MTRSTPLAKSSEPPLCVDLDGTLIRSDLLVETYFMMVGKRFSDGFRAFLWLERGKGRLKAEIAKRVTIDPTSLPYNKELLKLLHQERDQGRRLLLVTASDQHFAQAVADHLGLFDDVLGSTSTINLSGRSKARKLVGMFGEKGFDYAGNAMVDLKIWKYSRKAIIVNPTPKLRLIKQVEKVTSVAMIVDEWLGTTKDYLKAMRLHQWLKNLLIFIPILVGHQLNDLSQVFQSILAFLAFSLCASSVYLLNDLLDLPSDRAHPRKSKRPFASGRLPMTRGLVLIPALLISAFLIAWFLPEWFLPILLLYFSVTLAYSLTLKRVVVLDVLILAGLYTIRIAAGAAAVNITPTFWLMAFSMFLFLNLAMVKRYSELLDLSERKQESALGRGYRVVDLETLFSLGSASGYMAVMVLALYINSSHISSMYTHPKVIWLLCPLMLFWVSRIWLKTRRGEMPDDPVVFATEDTVSLWVAGVMAVTLWVAV